MSALDQQAPADKDEVPLFATRVPDAGLTPGLQAIAALIDEDEEVEGKPQQHGASRKRKAASMGTAQVHLALASFCDSVRDRSSPVQDEPAPSHSVTQRRRMEE